MKIVFTTNTIIPGTNVKANYQQAAHLFFPNALQASGATPSATWDGVDATVERDEIAECRVDGVCYIVWK
jgi:hypothetical protein